MVHFYPAALVHNHAAVDKWSYCQAVRPGLRPIPMGRGNWLFAWTELVAQRIGAIQSLLATCQLQGVNSYTYLVDVLQRIDRHPAKRVIELTPRVWKTLFPNNPLRFDLDRARDHPFQ